MTKLNEYITQKIQQKKILLMTHTVAGSLDKKCQTNLVRAMADSGADLIELQFPFSDPIADGPVITIENQKALDRGTTTAGCFDLAQRLREKTGLPLLVMTYFNIIYRFGPEKFINRAWESGIDGLIVPDIPPDQDNFGYFDCLKQKQLEPVQVFGLNTREDRIHYLAHYTKSMFYLPLRIGITGEKESLPAEAKKKILQLKKITGARAACGFGISRREHIDELAGYADIAVLGSRLISLYNSASAPKAGIAVVSDFLASLRK
ncbi:MAG: tryptophan synthase subunit alpha [Spirochaetes bacterium GWF1_41_5]|nr:MAG: tryptophan synthase subunit alpha [Spirochaetes bacterium GWF1_41_5]HBE02462.1 tryptophan synthase subunit alpha [Spirochaetia bacterium]